jgi:hypothetical protein
MGNKTGQPQEEATLGKIDKITETVFISDVHAIINPERRDRIHELKVGLPHPLLCPSLSCNAQHAFQIQHILTASHRNAAAERPLPGVRHEYLCIRDMLDENLLATGLLARGLKIIDEADSRNERILVHWWVSPYDAVCLTLAPVSLMDRLQRGRHLP